MSSSRRRDAPALPPAQLLGRPRVIVSLWALSLVAAASLVAVRYRDATNSLWYDYQWYFLPAAKRVAAGGSPYEVPGYVYSPVVAWVLAPMSLWEPWQQVAQLWTAISLGSALAAIAFTAAALSVKGQPWLTPVVFGVGAVTLLYNWPTTLVLWLGQTDLMVFAALSLAAWGAARKRPARTGMGLAAAALIKTWPAVIGLWLLRRGALERKRSIAWAAAFGILGLLAVAVVLGPDQLVAWLRAAAKASDQPEVVHYSASGFGHQLFGPQGPWPSPGAALAATLVLGAVVAGLLAIVLWWPGDPGLSLWHTALAVVLLLPVSHAVYLLLGLPMLWHWVARVVSGQRRDRPALAVLAVLLVWWFVAFRTLWPGDMTSSMATGDYAAVFLTSLAALGSSVGVEAFGTHRSQS